MADRAICGSKAVTTAAPWRVALAAAFVLSALAAAPQADAATIDTYDFRQVGYGPDGGGSVTGSFVGTVEPDGLIEIGDLTQFQLNFENFLFGLLPVNFFSFNTLGGSSSLDFATVVTNTSVCVGAAAAFGGAGGVSCGQGGVNGYVGGFTTQDLPVVTLVSSVTTPEPSTWAMMALGFAGLCALGYGRAKRRLAVPAS